MKILLRQISFFIIIVLFFIYSTSVTVNSSDTPTADAERGYIYNAVSTSNPSDDILEFESDTDFFDGPYEEYFAIQSFDIDTPAGSTEGDGTDTNYQAWPGSGTYGYYQLSSTLKYMYELLDQNLVRFIGSKYTLDWSDTRPEDVYYSGKLTREDLYLLYRAYFFDHPQYYFLSNSYSMTFGNDFTSLTVKIDPYYYSYAERKRVDDSIAEISAKWLKQAREQNDSYLQAVSLHDSIISYIDYAYSDSSHKTPQSAKWAHCLAGVFTGQGAVCEGYSRAYQYLLNLVGIENLYIMGTASGGSHSWNIVQIGNHYHPVDVTWDDLGSSNAETNSGKYYEYFATPEEVFEETHEAQMPYELPNLGNDDSHLYYKRTLSYNTNTLNKTSLNRLIRNATASRFGDYIYFYVNKKTLSSLHKELGKTDSISYYNSKISDGCLYIYKVTSN